MCVSVLTDFILLNQSLNYIKKLTKKARNKQKKTKVKIKQTSDGSILLLATPVVN